jgi:xanthine dehydrogenase accessory factor
LAEAQSKKIEISSLTTNEGQAEILMERFSNPRRVIIIGAVHIAAALTNFATILGFQVVIIDPRRKFATRERYPMADEILVKWPQDILHDLPIYENDYVVVISHDQKIDVPALDESLRSKANYIGLLGSKKTRQIRFDALKELKWDAQDLMRIHAPIGLDLGGNSAEEIALSIMAEIVKLDHQLG